jgi:hypothetical protein
VNAPSRRTSGSLATLAVRLRNMTLGSWRSAASCCCSWCWRPTGCHQFGDGIAAGSLHAHSGFAGGPCHHAARGAGPRACSSLCSAERVRHGCASSRLIIG